MYKYSMKNWAKFLPKYKINPGPEIKTAADMLSTYEFLKISELNWVDPIN